MVRILVFPTDMVETIASNARTALEKKHYCESCRSEHCSRDMELVTLVTLDSRMPKIVVVAMAHRSHGRGHGEGLRLLAPKKHTNF